MDEESKEWSNILAKLAKEATSEAFERAKRKGLGPTIFINNKIIRVWSDNSFTVLKTITAQTS